MKSVSKFSARAVLLGIAFISGSLIFGTWLSCAASPNSPTPGRFLDVTEKLGIHFRQQASPTGRKYLLETMGSGVALFDYDNDGRLDVFFANGARLDHTTRKGSTSQK